MNRPHPLSETTFYGVEWFIQIKDRHNLERALGVVLWGALVAVLFVAR